MPDTSFLLPNASNAHLINEAIQASWRESLVWCFDQPALSQHRERLEGIQLPIKPSPIDYGFYFDLATAIASDVSQDAMAELISQLVARWKASFERHTRHVHGLAIGTLRAPFYSQSETDCLIRWLDLEPENSMGLSPLSDDELRSAEQSLTQMLDALKILCPGFHAEFLAITREIIMAKPSGQQKFTFGGASSFALWGALTLNLDAHPDWWLYLPRLVHEYSHNMLFGFARHEPLVLNEPDERYRSPLRQAERPIDGIYHAAYVSAREAFAMKQALERIGQGDLPEQLVRIEDYCRMTLHDSTQSFWDCLAVLDTHGRLSDLGSRIMQDVTAQMRTHGLCLDSNLPATIPS